MCCVLINEMLSCVHAMQRWGLKKTRPRYVVENRGKCKTHAVPSVTQSEEYKYVDTLIYI